MGNFSRYFGNMPQPAHNQRVVRGIIGGRDFERAQVVAHISIDFTAFMENAVAVKQGDGQSFDIQHEDTGDTLGTAYMRVVHNEEGQERD